LSTAIIYFAVRFQISFDLKYLHILDNKSPMRKENELISENYRHVIVLFFNIDYFNFLLILPLQFFRHKETEWMTEEQMSIKPINNKLK
jgi:hypothetical protein